MSMDDWMDLDRNGEIDPVERMFGEEALCASREEHIALFGDSGDFGDDDLDFDDENDDF